MNILFTVVILIASILLRIIPHSPNVAAIGAIALWSGATLPKRWGWIVPLAAMAVSDSMIGFYDVKLMGVVYASFILYALVGWTVRGTTSVTRLIGATLGASTLFFLITNFAVWALSNWYPHTPQGLLWAYTLGLPFFRNTLLGDLGYTGVIFGAYRIIAIVLHNRTYRSKFFLKFLTV